jgi:hypothetical protein
MMGISGSMGMLKIVLGGDTSGLDKSLKDSQSSLSAFGKTVAIGLTALAGAAAAATTALGFQVKAAIDSADSLNKMSQSAGVSTEELSKLKYAGELADVSTEMLGKSMGKLSKALVAAGTDATSQAGRAFAAMGVEVKNTDGTLRSSSEVLLDTADKFAGYKDGAEKTALAIALFGKAGASMIPLLNAGRDGLEESGKEAEKFGLVLDKKTTMAAEAFNDNLKKMDLIKQGLATTIAAKILPGLEALSEKLLASRQESTLWTTVGDALAGVFNKLVTASIALITTWERIFATVANLKTAFGQLSSGEFTAAWETMRKSAADTATALGALKDTAANLASTNPGETWQSEALALKGLSREVMGYGEAWKQAAPSVGEGVTSTTNVFDKFIASQQKSLAAQQADFLATGMAAGAKERLKTVLQGLAVAQANGIVLTDAQRIKLTETANAAELMALKLGNLALLGGESNPFIALGVAIDATNLKLQQGGLAAQDYATLSAQSAQLTSKLWADSATSLGGSFESIGSSLSQLGEGWARFAKVGQAIGAAVAFVNAYVAASEAFAKTPFPANVAVAAGVLAKGIAMVAAIKGAAIPKAAMGGAFMVPGGLGGGDKVLAQMALEPGELVEVTSNRADGYKAGGARGEGKTVIVQFADPISRMFGEKLFPVLNELLADGHVLNLKPA